MADQSKRLVAFGFTKKKDPVLKVGKYGIKIQGKTPQEKLKFIQEKREELVKENESYGKLFDKELENAADHEWVEMVKNQMVMTDYPQSLSMQRASLESWHQSIENYYYWCVNFLGDLGFAKIHKITDVFTASEHSSFYGAGAQKLGLSQDKVAQYLATIGKMVKDLFQLVRELRWIDERLEIYRGAIGVDKEGNKTKEGPLVGPEQTLKNLWVDLVDGVVGGQRTASNLFLMAQQVQFTVLPDLFFSIHPKTVAEVDKVVDEQAKEFNETVKNALRRKLVLYVGWKNSTFDEMKTRRKFTLDYLRQHYQVIKLYITWVKPYVKHIERLSGEQDLLNNPRLIAAFESSLVEIEILATTKEAGATDYGVMLMTFEYHTKPSMQYPGDSGYHRGPIHVGTTKITWRTYSWNDEKIKNFIAMKKRRKKS